MGSLTMAVATSDPINKSFFAAFFTKKADSSLFGPDVPLGTSGKLWATTPGNAYPGTPLLVEYSKCSAVSGYTIGWIACAAIAPSANPCRMSFSLPG